MKNLSKILTIFLIFSFLLPSCAYTKNVSEYDIVVSMQISNPIMMVNGQKTEIDEGRNTTPIINNSRTLVPIRAIIEAFGGSVDWNGVTQTVTLKLDNDTIKLNIDNTNAYLNNKHSLLDVAPTIINGRTLLPIRFIAESFNLGVAWEDDTRTISIISNGFDDYEYQRLINEVPEYSGKPYVVVNNNKPYFKDYEIIGGSFEFYADLDELGRCDVAMASVGSDIMPTKKRESISSVIPTGWKNEYYDFVDGGYVYNRCHLIGFQLTGENANKRNLITGTRYMNVDGMLPFENMVDDYIEDSGNNVMYRSTPVFTGNNLVADGVLLEAYSVEDNGKGVKFCVYCYNVQPNVYINYATGLNSLSNDVSDTTTSNTNTNENVYRTPSGKKYHNDADCGGKNSYKISIAEAINAGLSPCSKCTE